MLSTSIAPGDVVLAPNPSYPIHTFGFIIAGATIRSVPTTPDEHYWESLERAMNYTVPRPSVLVVSYPSNPTAETVDLAFYERLVAWAKENQVWVVSDLAYSELYFDGRPTPSIMQVPGAKDVAIEFTSMSKTYSMAGWRMGFAVGNERIIAALARVKSYLDYGAFTPVQGVAFGGEIRRERTSFNPTWLRVDRGADRRGGAGRVAGVLARAGRDRDAHAGGLHGAVRREAATAAQAARL